MCDCYTIKLLQYACTYNLLYYLLFIIIANILWILVLLVQVLRTPLMCPYTGDTHACVQ